MKQLLLMMMLCLGALHLHAQQGFAFNRLSTSDGIGLASNVIRSIYQDKRGFIWVGTANGLQRFDGSKFIQFRTRGDELPHASVASILPADSSLLFLAMDNPREFGFFDRERFIYRRIPLKPSGDFHPRSEFTAWNDEYGQIYLSVSRYGIMRYDAASGAMVDDHRIKLPAGWDKGIRRVFNDTLKKQIWICTDSGLCVYDRRSADTWSRHHNPTGHPVIANERIQENINKIFIDSKRRYWIIGWPFSLGGGQHRFCLDSMGRDLHQDTLGLNWHSIRYSEYHDFFETKSGQIWVYGMETLFNYDQEEKRFRFIAPDQHAGEIGINYETVFQVMDDRDGSIWIATNRGLYFTATVTGTFSVVNLMFDKQKHATEITDILQLPNGDYWLTSWGEGVQTLNSRYQRIPNFLYANPPPADWNYDQKTSTRLTWSLCRQSANGQIWVGCNSGTLLIHDPEKRSTRYLRPPVLGGSTIRYITEDRRGNLWLGTQSGKLVKYQNDRFFEVQDFNTIIYKIYPDSDGWLWISAHEKGLFAVDPVSGNILQHYVSGNHPNHLYANTGNDIEQLNDSVIVFGAGALNFINKRTGRVHILQYEDGLPSNTVKRLRMDRDGYCWIITQNGLCRYNPHNNRITSYGRRDGIALAEQTDMADYFSREGYLMFGGSNALIMFHPSVFMNTQAPPDVTLTDFKLFNEFVPVDSLMRESVVRLSSNQHAISIYFASLSYMQRDKLTYYYKMEGLDNDWIRADRSLYVNYSSIPPGRYVFKVYCENLEGVRSKSITEMHIHIRPPFYRTGWFMSVCLFGVALLIYLVHSLRVNKLLAVEKLRNSVARDLHDDMGSTLSTINILSSMAKSKMQTDAVKAAEYISKITDNSQRMMEAMDDIVWSIKPSNDSMHKIVARMREFATNVLESKEMELDFAADDSILEVKLNMQARRDLFLIFKEAVNNAAKYSAADKVRIRLQQEQKKLLLLVEDNGRGFDADAADEGNGLGNMQKRADSLQGTISIRSAPGQGTSMRLLIPLQ